MASKFVKIFVGNLPRSVAEQQLDELFSLHGACHRTQVVRNKQSGRSMCYGFVQMVDAEEARRAVEALDGSEVEGRRLAVNLSSDTRPLSSPGREAAYVECCAKNVAYDCTAEQLQAFTGAQSVHILRNPQTGGAKGIAFLTYPNRELAELAVMRLNGTILMGRPLSVYL